jgi:uncharacterized lipoprotein YmbA
MNNYLLIISIFVLTVGVIVSNPQVSMAKYEEESKSDNNDVSEKISQNNDQTTSETNSDVIPAEPPTQTTIPTLQQCDSSNTNPTCVAATNELIKEQTELEKQRMLIAQQQQEQNEISMEINVLSIILTQPRVKILVALIIAGQVAVNLT